MSVPVVYLTSDALLEDYSKNRLDYDNIFVFLPIPVLFDPNGKKVPEDWYLMRGASLSAGFPELLADSSSTISGEVLMQMHELCWCIVSVLKGYLRTIPNKRLAHGRSTAALRLFLAQNDLPAPRWLENLTEQEEPDWKKLIFDFVDGQMLRSEVVLIVDAQRDINRRLLADIADACPDNLGYVIRA